MAKLPDLPLEALLGVIEWSLQSWGDLYSQFLWLSNLSLVYIYVKPHTNLASPTYLFSRWYIPPDVERSTTSVVFEAMKEFHRCPRFPFELWHWPSRANPASVTSDRPFVLPSVLEPLTSPPRTNGEAARSWRFCYFGDCILCGYFDFTTYLEDTGLAIRMKGAWAVTEEHLRRVFVDDLTKFDVRRDGIRDLHPQETDEDKEVVLGFERAVVAALPDHRLLNCSINAAF
ncbi:hypothetical protein BJY52DRAFT_1420056 [Lactarius psammicola]|nr:hypothetical protein BJY52DRAFT_1420056 [Lactarius psammicola]